MRPVPRPRHHLAVLCLLATASLYGYLALLDDRLSDTQISIATAALKRYDRDLFANDMVYGSSGLWKLHTPAFQAILELTLVPTNYRDPGLPLRLMTPVVSLVFLAGMYALLYRQTRSWSVATFVAILSSAVVYTIGESYWGVGSLNSITPAAIVMAMSPLIVLSYMRYRHQWQLVLVFGFIGLCGNIHLVTAMNLTLVMLILHVATHRFAPVRWGEALACGAAAAFGALPYAAYYLMLREGFAPFQAPAALVQAALRLGDVAVLYPDLLKSLLYWALLAAVLVIPAAAVLTRIERYRVRDANVWVWFIAAGLIVSLVLHGASQLVGILFGTAPPLIDLSQAASLVMLPLYVLFAQAVTNLFRIVRGHGHRALVRWVLAALAVAWMIQSDNLRLVRYAAADAATAFMEEQDKPQYVQDHHERAAQRREMNAIAAWARMHTPTDAVFLFDRNDFRLPAERAISASKEDIKYFYYLAPSLLDEWVQLADRQRRLLHPPTGSVDVEALTDLARDIAVQRRIDANLPWYVIFRPGVVPTSAANLQPIMSENWGRHLQVYRLRLDY